MEAIKIVGANAHLLAAPGIGLTMKTLLLLLAFTATANAELVADATGGVKYDQTQLRLNYRPDDSAKPYITVFGTGSRHSEVVNWFDTNEELRTLKAQAHFNVIDTNSAMFKQRYASTTPNKLTIRFQDANGSITHETSDLPLSAEAFIKQTNQAECFRRRQPTPPPQRDPEPQPLAPLPVKPAARFPWLLLGILTTAGAVAGAAIQWRKTKKG
jgi:hypothetical protein